jgi:hypothetical protein
LCTISVTPVIPYLLKSKFAIFFELIKIGISFYYLFSPEHEELWVPPCKSGYKSNTFFEKEEGIREIFP